MAYTDDNHDADVQTAQNDLEKAVSLASSGDYTDAQSYANSALEVGAQLADDDGGAAETAAGRILRDIEINLGEAPPVSSDGYVYGPADFNDSLDIYQRDVAAAAAKAAAADEPPAPSEIPTVPSQPYTISPDAPPATTGTTTPVSSTGGGSTIVNPPSNAPSGTTAGPTITSTGGGASGGGGGTSPVPTSVTTPVNTAITSAATGTANTGFDLASAEGFIETYIPSIGSGIVQWIIDNIINPIKAFFIWLLNIWLGILGWEYDTVKKAVTYPVTLSTPIPTTLAEIQAYESEIGVIINNPTNVWEYAGAIVIRIALAFSAIAARLQPLITQVEQVANYQQPTGLLSVSDLIDSQYKGSLTYAQAVSVAKYNNTSSDDYATLFTNAAYSPSAAEAATWLARGIISQGQYDNFATQARSTAEIAGYQQTASISPPSPSSLISASPRIAAVGNGFLPQSLNSGAPANVVNAYAKAQIDTQQAAWDWINHWNIPSPEFFAAGQYRGVYGAGTIQNAALANGYPPEVANAYEQIIAPLIPTRTVSTLLAQNIITLAQATQFWGQAGYSPAQISVLAAYAATLTKKPPKGPPADLAKLALNDAIALYDDGTINAAKLLTIYEAHGWTADAANLAIEYIDLKNAATARKAYATELVDEVVLGTLTQSSAISLLYANGFTQQEVVAYQRKMGKGTKAKKTQPTIAQVTALYAAGYIGAEDVEGYLIDAGWYEPFLLGQLQIMLAKAPPTADSAAVIAAGPPVTPADPTLTTVNA